MSWGKFLLVTILGVMSGKAGVITNGYVIQNFDPHDYYTFTGSFQLSVDGFTLTGAARTGGSVYQCFSYTGPTCYVDPRFTLLGGIDDQILSVPSYQLIGTLIRSNSSQLILTNPIDGLQIYTVPFTLSGTLNLYPDFNPNEYQSKPYPPCILCGDLVNGSGIETLNILHDAKNGLYTVQSFTAQITTTPEPATTILITAGIGVLGLLRKRFSGSRSQP